MIKTKKVGFTLIELLVSLTIIAIITGLALVAFSGSKKSARDARRQADIEQIRSALEMYRADKGEYPPTTIGSCPPGSWDRSHCNPNFLGELVDEGYLSQVPVDPINQAEGWHFYNYQINGTYGYRLLYNPELKDDYTDPDTNDCYDGPTWLCFQAP